ncbi:hypothetical protein [Microbacterium sp. 2FI]|uniref:hypothetical protein n=1 Tax=Microbacterium sp. 2FI TaxID=2502193 RepID=UPI0010F45176|nr:hypothetical protein [Microbacterium sp. 2FI]
MTSALRALSLAAASTALLLSLAACSTAGEVETTPSSDTPENVAASVSACDGDEGVTFVVDPSALGTDATTWCVFADDTIGAAEVVELAGVVTEGTVEYGDQVVCRVNGVPAEDVAITADDGSEYFETCESMAPAFAYWGLWVQPEGAEWDYAQEGLSTLQLEPGDAVALLFTLNGEPAAPAALTP